MPATRYHLVLVLSHHHARQLGCQITLQVGKHQLVVVAGGQQVVRAGREPDGANIGGVGFETLQRPASSDVIQHAAGVLVARDQQSTARFYAHGRHGRSLPGGGGGGWGDDVDTASGPEVPEPDSSILRTADEHGASPVVQGQYVTAVAAECLVRLARRTVRDVDLAVACAAADQQT